MGFFVCVCVCVLYLHVICAYCVHAVPEEARRGHQILWKWMDMGLKIDPRSSTRAANAPAHLLWVSKNLLQWLIPTDVRRDAMRSPK